MKNFCYFVISIFLLGCFVCPQHVHPQAVASEKSPFNSAMSFEIALDKTEYVQLEPITLRCRFVNRTARAQTTFIPSFDQHSGLEVSFNGEAKPFDEITYLRSFLIFPPEPAILQPDKGVEQELLLETNLEKFFPQPGRYTIRFSLRGTPVWSNYLEITIKKPTGTDKEAFDFIQENKGNSIRNVLFHWNHHVKLENRKTLLEEFVSKYSESIYGEIAIYQLGNHYFRAGELEKAKIELEKLKYAKAPRIAKEAKATLADVNNASVVKHDKP